MYVHQHPAGDQEEPSYESLDDSRKRSTSPLTGPERERLENTYLKLGEGKPSNDYLPMNKSLDDVPDVIYEDMDGQGRQGRQGPIYSNVNTHL